jgi:hypothetical protein
LADGQGRKWYGKVIHCLQTTIKEDCLKLYQVFRYPNIEVPLLYCMTFSTPTTNPQSTEEYPCSAGLHAEPGMCSSQLHTEIANSYTFFSGHGNDNLNTHFNSTNQYCMKCLYFCDNFYAVTRKWILLFHMSNG